MNIILNGEPYDVGTEVDLASLIGELLLEGKRFAVEVNEEVIARSDYRGYRLCEGDCIEIVQAIGGG